VARGMSVGQRIFFGILAFFVAEQILISTVVWYQTDPAAVAAYAARADLRILSDVHHNVLGEESPRYQSCEKQRFLYVYQGLMCITRRSVEITPEGPPCISKNNCPDVVTTTIYYWSPNSILNPFTGHYFEIYTAWGLWSMDVENRKVLRREQ
jgi:hypothetical protein